jgi:hypothetical protein
MKNENQEKNTEIAPANQTNFFEVNGGIVYGNQKAHKFTKDELEELANGIEEEDKEYTDWKLYNISMVADSYEIKEDGTLQLITNYFDPENGLIKSSIRIHNTFTKEQAENLLFKELTFINGIRIEKPEMDLNGVYSKVKYLYVAEDVKAGNTAAETAFNCNVYTQLLVSYATVIQSKKKKLPSLKIDAILKNGTRKDLFSITLQETAQAKYAEQIRGNMIRINDIEKNFLGNWISKTNFEIL